MADDETNPARKVITDYAQAHFRYFRTADGTVYAQRNGHPVARPIRSQGTTGSHRQELMVGLFRDGRGVFNGSALKEALDLIEALALYEDVQPVHIRVAPGFDGATWLDLGRDDGQSVRIHPTGWDILTPDPREVCWRRTQLTGELPLPAKDTGGKGIDLLMRLCNFANAETECLAIVWLIGCLGPSVPVPAPFLTGPQGAGKSTGGRMLVRIVEGMSGDLRRAPKDEENLIAAVAAGWVTALDNLSHMTPDLSDAMCCIVTGAESVKRALFTDGDVFRVGYRRPLLLTGIDVGVIRPDLAERLLPLRLERPRVRRTEAELWSEYAEVLPVVLGSLLDLTVKVRAVAAETPTDLRMADFAHLCAQFDAATGLGALAAYRASLDDLNDDVIEGDLLAQTVLRHADTIEPGAAQRMTSTEWLHCLSRFYSGDEPRPLPKGWPTTGKVLSDRLKRLQPTLAARGVLIDTGHNSEGRYLDRPPVLRQRQMVRGRGRLPCDPGRRTHRPVHPAADDHPPALDQRPTRFQRPRLSRRGLVQPPSGEAGRVPALRQERHRHGEVQGRRPGDLRRSRPREPIDLHQEGTRQHGPPHHLFAQGVVAVETLRSDLEVRTKFLDQVAAHTPDHRLLDDFGTLRVVFGILLKGGQDIRVDSLLAFAQVSLLQAVRRLRAMNAEVEVVAIRR